jgi:hypothetical protein
VVGVNPSTIDTDLAAHNQAVGKKKPKKNRDVDSTPTRNQAPTLSGAAAAKAVESHETKDERKAAKQEARDQREADLGAKQLALPTKKYGVIYADPPWHFQPYSDVTGTHARREPCPAWFPGGVFR